MKIIRLVRNCAGQKPAAIVDHVVVGYISNHVSCNQDLGYLMNPYCLLAIYLVTYVDAPGDLA